MKVLTDWNQVQAVITSRLGMAQFKVEYRRIRSRIMKSPYNMEQDEREN